MCGGAYGASLISFMQVPRGLWARERVYIWGDPWLPDQDNPFIQSPVLEEMESEMVNLFRATEYPRWKKEVLHQLFMVRDKQLMLSIPLKFNNEGG